jgi:hypothetical protein
MHLHLGELLLAAVYMAAALIVLVAIFSSHRPTRRDYQLRKDLPPIKRDNIKDKKDKRDAA